MPEPEETFDPRGCTKGQRAIIIRASELWIGVRLADIEFSSISVRAGSKTNPIYPKTLQTISMRTRIPVTYHLRPQPNPSHQRVSNSILCKPSLSLPLDQNPKLSNNELDSGSSNTLGGG